MIDLPTSDLPNAKRHLMHTLGHRSSIKLVATVVTIVQSHGSWLMSDALMLACSVWDRPHVNHLISSLSITSASAWCHFPFLVHSNQHILIVSSPPGDSLQHIEHAVSLCIRTVHPRKPCATILSFGASTSESCAERRIVMSKVENGLW